MIKDDAAFIPVPSLSLTDVSRILSSWLDGAGRSLTEEQFRFVVSAFNDCQLPLFLKLCFDLGCTWASYSKPSLAEDVRSMISVLFRWGMEPEFNPNHKVNQQLPCVSDKLFASINIVGGFTFWYERLTCLLPDCNVIIWMLLWLLSNTCTSV